MRKFAVSVADVISNPGFNAEDFIRVQHPEHHFNLLTHNVNLKELAEAKDVDALLASKEQVELSDVFGIEGTNNFAILNSGLKGDDGTAIAMVNHTDGKWVLCGTIYEQLMSDPEMREGYTSIRLTDEEMEDVLEQVRAL